MRSLRLPMRSWTNVRHWPCERLIPRDRSRNASDEDSERGTALSQHQRGDNTDTQKANDLGKHVAGDVNTGKAIPVPIRNIRRNGGENSCDQNEADSAGETCDRCLGKEENNEDRFDQFGGEFDGQGFRECERPRVIVNQQTRRAAGHFCCRLFHRFTLFLPGRVWSDTGPRKKVKARLFSNVRLHGGENSLLIGNFADASFAQRQHHVRNRCPDKHGDRTENTREKNFHEWKNAGWTRNLEEKIGRRRDSPSEGSEVFETDEHPPRQFRLSARYLGVLLTNHYKNIMVKALTPSS